MSAALYVWLKALHVAAALTFVGGLLANRLYLATLTPDGVPAPGIPADLALSGRQQDAIRRVRRWDRAVTTPAMLLVWACGLALALKGGWLASGWLQGKLVAVLALSALHGAQSGALRRAAGGGRMSSSRAAIIMGPIILALVLAIAVLAVVKPG